MCEDKKRIGEVVAMSATISIEIESHLSFALAYSLTLKATYAQKAIAANNNWK
jgi:hypothetical protein